MTEPAKKPKIRIAGLEIATTIAGLAVVAGLVMESSSEIYHSWVTWTWPSKELWGNALVALGVFAEVVIGIFIARFSKREQMESNERIAQAEKTTAEANLARVKLEQMRVIEQPVREDLIKLLTEWGMGRVDIVVFDHHIPETQLFAHQMLVIFEAAKWRCELWESRGAKYRLPGASIIFAVADGHVDQFRDLAMGLHQVFQKADIDSGLSLGTFNCKGLFDPGDFVSTYQNPRVFMGKHDLAPFRVQIGQKQVTKQPKVQYAVVKTSKPEKQQDPKLTS